MPDKLGCDNNFGDKPASTRHQQFMILHAFDTCDCGDYRHQHVNGTGRCKLGSLCTPSHCQQFRLHCEATEIPQPYR